MLKGGGRPASESILIVILILTTFVSIILTVRDPFSFRSLAPAKCRILEMTSDREHGPRALVEYMANGDRVTTHVPVRTASVRSGGTAIVFYLPEKHGVATFDGNGWQKAVAARVLVFFLLLVGVIVRRKLRKRSPRGESLV